MKALLTVFFSIICLLSLEAAPKSYVMLSVPKSGSHMIQKLLTSLSSNPNISPADVAAFGPDIMQFPPHNYASLTLFSKSIPTTKRQNIYAHFNFSALMRQFVEQNPSYVKIIMIRDPRDICVSLVSYIQKDLDQVFPEGASFSERLKYVIESEGFLENSVFNVQKECLAALDWMQDPSVVVCRFETLCGPNGGGSIAAQNKQVKQIAKALHVHLKSKKRKAVIDDIWGGTRTFRKGLIGQWKEHFSAEHKELFKSKMGSLLIALGYEKDNQW